MAAVALVSHVGAVDMSVTDLMFRNAFSAITHHSVRFIATCARKTNKPHFGVNVNADILCRAAIRTELLAYPK